MMITETTMEAGMAAELTDNDMRKVREALAEAQGALNPLSGFLRRGQGGATQRYLENVRDKLRAAITIVGPGEIDHPAGDDAA